MPVRRPLTVSVTIRHADCHCSLQAVSHHGAGHCRPCGGRHGVACGRHGAACGGAAPAWCHHAAFPTHSLAAAGELPAKSGRNHKPKTYGNIMLIGYPALLHSLQQACAARQQLSGHTRHVAGVSFTPLHLSICLLGMRIEKHGMLKSTPSLHFTPPN
jgi:hypothetical protein